jgi:hypothetical protein
MGRRPIGDGDDRGDDLPTNRVETPTHGQEYIGFAVAPALPPTRSTVLLDPAATVSQPYPAFPVNVTTRPVPEQKPLARDPKTAPPVYSPTYLARNGNRVRSAKSTVARQLTGFVSVVVTVTLAFQLVPDAAVLRPKTNEHALPLTTFPALLVTTQPVDVAHVLGSYTVTPREAPAQAAATPETSTEADVPEVGRVVAATVSSQRSSDVVNGRGPPARLSREALAWFITIRATASRTATDPSARLVAHLRLTRPTQVRSRGRPQAQPPLSTSP